MANSYIGADFSIDTNTNVAGLTALKGGAPAVTDNLFIHTSATVTFEAAVSMLIVKLGETVAGDPGAGFRRGNLIINPGVTVTWGGAAVATNSGIKSVPAATGAETKNNTVTISGNYGSHVVMNNQGGAAAAAQQYCINMAWGTLTYDYLEMRNPWGVSATILYAPSTTYTNSTSIAFGHLFVSGLYSTNNNASLFLSGIAGDVFLRIDTGYIDIDWSTGYSGNSIFFLCSSVGGSGFAVGSPIIRSLKIKLAAAATSPYICHLTKPGWGIVYNYSGYWETAPTDIRGSEFKIAKR